MLNAQLHCPVFTHECRTNASQVAPVGKRNLQRIFRLEGTRSTRRDTRSR